MMSKEKFHNLLRRRILILDGATGTQLHKRGMPVGACPEQWCIEHPQDAAGLAAEYFKAGSDIVYTSTFGANRIKLAEFAVTNTAEVNRKLALITRSVCPRNKLVAGDIGPTGKFVQPFGDLLFEDAVAVFKEQILGLVAGKVDLFVIETMIDIQEARAALIAVKETSKKPVMVSITCEKDGRTLGGTDVISALITLQSLGADAVGINCSAGPQQMLALIQQMKPFATCALFAKPNAGLPKLVGDKTVFDMLPREFASFAHDFAAAGVNLMGGCCGTSPEYIRCLRKAFKGYRPRPAVRQSLSALSSHRRYCILQQPRGICVIGECINPTGKKDLAGELSAGGVTRVRQLASQQEKSGAHLLDVNVGAPGVDEPRMMSEAIQAVSTASTLPLVIDSVNPVVVERALRLYPGRALINSISGEKIRVRTLLPLAARYGAMFILLPLADKHLPHTAQERKAIVGKVFARAKKFGFTKDDMVIDGLALTVSSDERAPEQTLQTLEWAHKEFGSNTVIGLSNISFGLPKRVWANSAFLAMARQRGLTMAILNPLQTELMHCAISCDCLQGLDAHASAYIARFKQDSSAPVSHADAVSDIPLHQRLYAAVVDGDQRLSCALTQEALSRGELPHVLLDTALISAISRVGELFEKKEYFLPQLIASAQAMQEAVRILEPLLDAPGARARKRLRVILATVEGDIHDIGKNIVALMLKNNGFDVIDLGKDVPASRIINEIKRVQPVCVGLSALMTTTMARMKPVIELARAQGLQCMFIVGGAVVTPEYAAAIGAHFARDGVHAVKEIKRYIVSISEK